MVKSENGEVKMIGTQSTILADISCVCDALRNAVMNGTFDVVKGREDEFLNYVAEHLTNDLLQKNDEEESKEVDFDTVEDIKEEIDNFMERIIKKIRGEEK